MKKTEFTELEWPGSHSNILSCLIAMAHKNFQMQEWVSEEYPRAFWPWWHLYVLEELDLYDLYDEGACKKAVGIFFHTEEEAQAVQDVMDLINKICDEVGEGKLACHYYNHPSWDLAVEASKKAAELLLKREPLDSFAHKYDEAALIREIRNLKAVGDKPLKSP